MSVEAPTDQTKQAAADVGIRPQPDPISQGAAPSMHDLVIEDMRKRREFGQRKYGTLLQANNGRNPLQDAYEEVLDLAVYLRQAIEEQQ